jgi:hypothetical protein
MINVEEIKQWQIYLYSFLRMKLFVSKKKDKSFLHLQHALIDIQILQTIFFYQNGIQL